jgi:hypothetical protein
MCSLGNGPWKTTFITNPNECKNDDQKREKKSPLLKGAQASNQLLIAFGPKYYPQGKKPVPVRKVNLSPGISRWKYEILIR